MGLVKGLTAIVTGSGAGIGRATAACFATESGQVVVSDINTKGGAETVKMIEKIGGKAIFVPADVSKAGDVAALIKAAIAAHGKLDCAVNNAGIEGKIAPFIDQPADNFDKIIAINLKGTFLCLQAEIDAMLKTGDIDTRMLDSLVEQATGGTQTSAQVMHPLHPIGRIGTPQKVAELIVWRSSPRASFVTGAIIPVDGGYVAQQANAQDFKTFSAPLTPPIDMHQ